MVDFNAIGPVVLIIAVLLGMAVALLALTALWPLVGTLTRYWAHYRPKRVVLGDEDRGERGILQINTENEASTFTGYWSLFLRVKRVEGTRGLWKGLGTFYILFCCSLAMTLALVFGFTVLRIALSPRLPLFILFTLILLYAISIPVRVVINRSLTTSRRLYFHQPMVAYRTLLFTPAERRNPLRLCLLPGLLFAIVLLDIETSILSSVKDVIKDALNYQRSFTLGSIGLSILLSVISALFLTPIEVIITRLSVQEIPSAETVSEQLPAPAVSEAPAPGYPTHSIEAEDPPNYTESEGIEYAGAEEDVINLRTDQEPYKGFVDCARCIIREEGWGTFWRGWGILASLFVLLDMDLVFLRNMSAGM